MNAGTDERGVWEPPVEPKLELKVGYVALLDVLGFKGIWQHYHVDQIIRKMTRIRDAGKAQEELHRIDPLRFAGMKSNVQIAFLSDAVFIGAQPSDSHGEPSNADNVRRFLLSQVLFSVRRVLIDWVEGDPAMNMRGCITYGKYLAHDPFFVEPAMDEAAALYEEANAAIVWLAPSARDLLDSEESEHIILSGTRLCDFDVPLKAGGYRTWVVDPLATPGTLERRGDVYEGIERAFQLDASIRLDVAIKRQNTNAFLKHLRETRGALIEPGE